MMNRNKSGFIVETKDGKLGRTYHIKGLVNNKIPVYLATKVNEQDGFKIPISYEEKAILCDPETLNKVGYID